MREAPPKGDLTDLLSNMVTQYQLSNELEPEQTVSAPAATAGTPAAIESAAVAADTPAAEPVPLSADKAPSDAALAARAEGLAAPVYPHPLLEKMAVESLRLKASDIFISTGFAPAFKIDGTLTPAPVHPLSREEAAKIVYSSMYAAQHHNFAHEL